MSEMDRIDIPAYPREPTPTIDDFFKELNQVVDPELEEAEPPKNIMDDFLAKFKQEPSDPVIPNPDNSPIFEAVVADLKDEEMKDPEGEDESETFQRALAEAIKEVKYKIQ